MEEKLLTISNYNRAKYLDKSLTHIFTFEQNNEPLSFNPFPIFSENLGNTLLNIQKNYITLPLAKIIFPSILNNLLPEMILHYKKDHPNNFKQLKITKSLYSIYKSYPSFWIYFYPFIICLIKCV